MAAAWEERIAGLEARVAQLERELRDAIRAARAARGQ